MTRRSRAREVALQILYQDDLNPRHNPVETDDFLDGRLGSAELQEFARSLVAGVRRNRSELDACCRRRPTTGAWGGWRRRIGTCCGWGHTKYCIPTRPTAWRSTKPWNWPSGSARGSRRNSSTASWIACSRITVRKRSSPEAAADSRRIPTRAASRRAAVRRAAFCRTEDREISPWVCSTRSSRV